MPRNTNHFITLSILLALAACGDDQEAAAPAPVMDLGQEEEEDAATPDLPVDQGDEDAALDQGADLAPDADVMEDVVEDADAPPEEDIEEPPFTWEGVAPQPMVLAGDLALIEAELTSAGDPPLLIEAPLLYVMDTLSQTFFADDEVVGDLLFHEVYIRVGDKDLGLLAVKGRDMTPDEANAGIDIGGLVGHLYFNNRFTVFDYPRAQFFLVDQAPPPELPPPGYEDAPRGEALYDLPNLIPVVRPVIGAAGEVALLGDTSSRMTFVARRVFDAVDDGSLPRVEGYRFQTNFGEDPGFLTRLPRLQLGDVVVEDIEAVVVPDDNHVVGLLRANGVEMEGFLGANFWGRFALGVDGHVFSRDSGSEGGLKQLIFWGDGAPPARWAGRWTRVGVELSWRGGEVQVEMVFVGSAAEAAGLAPGAALLAIDGEDAAEMTLDEARARLQGEVGQVRRLRVRLPDAADPVEVEVAIEEILP
jgi:hypothetical protein